MRLSTGTYIYRWLDRMTPDTKMENPFESRLAKHRKRSNRHSLYREMAIAFEKWGDNNSGRAL
jgi:hypothetical protein